jgi:hypothetical protein
VKKRLRAEGKDRGNQKVEEKGISQATQTSSVVKEPALGGHDARYAERRPPSQEQKKRMLTVIDHIIL